MMSPLLNLVAPVHATISNASIEVMVNCMLAQTLQEWSLTIVADGPDPRIRAAVLGRYHHDPRITYLETSSASRDHGHTPREVGLNASTTPWTLLSGIDNYYVPVMVETVARAIEESIGLVYFDFLLDMKGELEAGLEYDRAMRHYTPSAQGNNKRLVLLDGKVEELWYGNDDGDDDDLHAVARAFVDQHGLTKGGGCDDADCVVQVLVRAMRADQPLRPPRALPPYSGHVSARLDREGDVDVGAVAVRTDIARHAGYRWRHHAADFAYIQACQRELQLRGLRAVKIPQTLYVHN